MRLTLKLGEVAEGTVVSVPDWIRPYVVKDGIEIYGSNCNEVIYPRKNMRFLVSGEMIFTMNKDKDVFVDGDVRMLRELLDELVEENAAEPPRQN